MSYSDLSYRKLYYFLFILAHIVICSVVIAFTWLIVFFHKYRSSLSDVFLEKGVLKICNNYRGPMPKCDFNKVRTASVNRICEYKIHCWYSNPKNCYKTFWLNLFLPYQMYMKLSFFCYISLLTRLIIVYVCHIFIHFKLVLGQFYFLS